MSALDIWRHELRAHLGTEILLRRDQAARALFICDAPRRISNADTVRASLERQGFSIFVENGLWRIDLSSARQTAFIRSLHPGLPPRDPVARALCHSLLSQGLAAAGKQPWPLIRLTLLRLDAREDRKLFGELSAAIAVCKRSHSALPAAAAYLIEETMIEREDRPC